MTTPDELTILTSNILDHAKTVLPSDVKLAVCVVATQENGLPSIRVGGDAKLSTRIADALNQDVELFAAMQGKEIAIKRKLVNADEVMGGLSRS